METEHALDRTGLLKSLAELADEQSTRTIARSLWLRETGISEWQIDKYFDSWNDFVREAGLEPDESNKRIEDDELFAAMREAFIESEGATTRKQFRKFCRHSDSVYVKRWGRWEDVLVHFREWVQLNDPEFPYLATLPSAQTNSAISLAGDGIDALGTWSAKQSTQLGPFLNFRGLQHAPINEQGVVFLFGIVAFELGYVVEGVGTGFPDCEAKRCVRKSGDMWERVRVEFEFRSRNFKAHGHDPAGCDVIVCWEDNWSESPVEVLELRSVIEHLDPG